MRTYEEMKAIALSNPVVRAEFDRIEREEMPMLDAILKARKDAKLTQEQVAKRMGVSTPVVSRLESALITGKHSPSIATLKRYAEAMGKRLDIRFA
jgi:predicted transcriptional regulator